MEHEFLNFLTDQDIEFIDFRFSDLIGRWHHFTFSTQVFDQSLLSKGIVFDGSSIQGWKGIERSDMLLVPDLSNYWMDLLLKNRTLVVLCDVKDPNTGLFYNRDPRTIAKNAKNYLEQHAIFKQAFFGPEPEFFIFDAVRSKVSPYENSFLIESQEHHDMHSLDHGYIVGSGGGYLPVGPDDTFVSLRDEILRTLLSLGIRATKHHHEVAAGQHEVGIEFNSIVKISDQLQFLKYAIKNVAIQNGHTATFMPKPIFGDNGSGMHVHFSLWDEKESKFYGSEYDGLSQDALYAIGGILKHAKALNAFTNPTVNSYKRLVPGYEAPVYKAYSACNRSAAIRIPHSDSQNAKRIEIRFPDPLANPYLAFSAILMAALDGIEHKIHPGNSSDDNLYKKDLGSEFWMAKSLNEALEALDQDRAFLCKGNVFDDDIIDTFIALKKEEINEVTLRTTPAEIQVYFGM